MLKTSPYLTIEKAGELLGVHVKTLMKWKSKGRGPKFLKLGGRIRYRQEDLDAFIAASVIDPATAVIARNKRTRRQQRVPERAARRTAA